MAKFEVALTTEVYATVVVDADNEWEARAYVEDGDIDDFVDNMRDVCYTNDNTCVHDVQEV